MDFNCQCTGPDQVRRMTTGLRSLFWTGLKRLIGFLNKLGRAVELLTCPFEAIDSYISDVNDNKNKKAQFVRNMKKIVYDVK